MHTDSNVLNIVIDKFPGKAKTLAVLFQKDENFREICEDFCLCKEAINKIIITDARKRKILKDYKHALKELELEMLDYINANLTVNDN
jgi:DNA modification methylase